MSTDAKSPESNPAIANLLRLGWPQICLVGLFALVAYLQLFWGAFDRDLWSSHEARAGLNARHFLNSGLWFLPGRSTDLPDLQKPPAYYWMVGALAGDANQVDFQAIRGPSLWSGLFCALVLIAIGKLQNTSAMGVWAGIVLLTAVHFAWGSRIGRIDLPLCAVVCASVYFQLKLLRSGSLSSLLLGGLVLAVGILLKGPIAVVHWFLVFSAVCLWGFWELKRVRVEFLLQGGLLLVFALAVSLPWFVCAHGSTFGEFTRVFFWEHNLERGMGTGRLRTHPFYFYIPQFFIDFFPWSLILVVFFLMVWLGWWNPNKMAPIAVLGGLWFLLEFCFFSICGYKRSDYLLPAYPGAALFSASVLRLGTREQVFQGSAQSLRGIGWTGVGIGVVAMFFWVHFQLPSREESRQMRQWARKWKPLVPEGEELVFFAEEGHSLAYHWGKPHKVIGKPDELSEVARSGQRFWVVTNPTVKELWPQGPFPVEWEVVGQNWVGDATHHKPLLLLEARLGALVNTKTEPQRLVQIDGIRD